MHTPTTFPYVSIIVHHDYSPILAQKESKTGLALGLPGLWSQYSKARVAVWEPGSPSPTGFTTAPSPPLECPRWALTQPLLPFLHGLSHFLLVSPCHLLSFQGKTGEDMMKASEVQVELGFQVQLPQHALLLSLFHLSSFSLSSVRFATCHLGLPLLPGQQPVLHIYADGLEHGEVAVEIRGARLGLVPMCAQLHVPQKTGDHHHLLHVAHHGQVPVHDSQQAVPGVALGQHLHDGFIFHMESRRLPRPLFPGCYFYVSMHSSLTGCQDPACRSTQPSFRQILGLVSQRPVSGDPSAQWQNCQASDCHFSVLWLPQ